MEDHIVQEARQLVRAARLPRGLYGTSRGKRKITSWRDPVSAITYALACRDATRIYRLADGWRFVGIITHDGRFVDERKEAPSQSGSDWFHAGMPS